MSTKLFLKAIESVFDSKDIYINTIDKEPYSNDWSSIKGTEPVVVVFPRNKVQVHEVVKLCNKFSLEFIGSGGRTGLSGGATPLNNEVIVSFDRMNKIIDYDEISKTVICEPGLVTKSLQDFANSQDLYYPIEFSSTGSSQIGGNIATNAGGIRVLKYGLTGKYVQGIEVISGDGDVLNFDKNIIKNATGPNLKNIFIGSEGIFGLFTSCRMQLINKPSETKVCILSFDDINHYNLITNNIRKFDIEAIEFFTKECSEKVHESFGNCNPVGISKYYFIVEYSDINLEDILNKMIMSNVVSNAVISQNDNQKEEIWKNRMLISESIYKMKPLKFDLAVPIHLYANLIQSIENHFTDINTFIPVLFGHAGDGNLHANFIYNGLGKELKKNKRNLDIFIYKTIIKHKGTISAEHGVGYLKKDLLKNYLPKKEIDTIKSLKKNFDPKNLLNPKKLIS